MGTRRLAVTLGDLSGIGPELILKVLSAREGIAAGPFSFYGNARVFARIAKSSGIPMPEDLLFLPGDAASRAVLPEGRSVFFDFPFPEESDLLPGQVQACCGRMAHRFICEAVKDVLDGHAAALVTAPINKEAMHLAGIPFPGHTELLASLTGTPDPCMAFYSPKLFVSLVTIHESIARVPALITPSRLERVFRLTVAACAKRANRPPRIGILALNPHAGENGLFGDEEGRVILPVMERLRAEGLDLSGPLVPDAAFSWLFSSSPSPFDGYVAMYHDQGLIPFKAAAFDSGVNVTLGLPIVRTSPDHGTAFDRAWRGTASASSLLAAIRLARGLSAP